MAINLRWGTVQDLSVRPELVEECTVNSIK